MQPAELVGAWAAAAAAPPGAAALTLLARLRGVAATELSAVPCGRRDAALLRAAAEVAAGPLAMTGECPACGERVEAGADVADLLADPPPDAVDHVAVGDLEVRAPTGADLQAAATAGTVEAARDVLLAACVTRGDGSPVAPPELSTDAVQAVSDAMAALDPQATVEIALTCPVCGHAWTAVPDAGALLLAATDARAGALLDDVHRLAGAYGWTHDAVLALPPPVRRHYLALVG